MSRKFKNSTDCKLERFVSICMSEEVSSVNSKSKVSIMINHPHMTGPDIYTYKCDTMLEAYAKASAYIRLACGGMDPYESLEQSKKENPELKAIILNPQLLIDLMAWVDYLTGAIMDEMDCTRSKAESIVSKANQKSDALQRVIKILRKLKLR
jgi:hypothetical protein